MAGLASAAGLLGFLSEPEEELRSFALKQLDSQVDLLWTEIAGSIGEMYSQQQDQEGQKLTITVKHFTKTTRSQIDHLPPSLPPRSTIICKNIMRAWLLR